MVTFASALPAPSPMAEAAAPSASTAQLVAADMGFENSFTAFTTGIGDTLSASAAASRRPSSSPASAA